MYKRQGLGIGILEEAALDHIPVIAIDPKGDMGNLLLTFPQLRPKDFRPWINERTALDKGQTPDEFAASQAALWKKGLGQWGQTGQRIAQLRKNADLAIYTPGSNSGLPVSVLHSFDAPDQALWDVLRAMGIDDWVRALPDGLDTELGERGSRLSAGERQLVALGRAFLVDPAVIVLDEATSNLDPETEVNVEGALRVLLAGRTAVVIAHRLAGAERADRVIMVDAGRIIADGRHTELVAAHPEYQQLVEVWRRGVA